MSRGKSSSRKKISREDEEEIVAHMTKSQELNINTVNINFKCKTPNQKKFITQIKEKVIVIGAGYPGSGKAQPLDSLIYTPSGPVKMGNLKVGDSICGVSESNSIIGIYPQGEKDIYKVTFQDGSSAECCLEHLWTVQQKGKKKNNWKTINLLKIKQDLEKGIEYKIPSQGIISFAKKELPIHPYLLGVLIAKGHFGKSIVLSNEDSFIINKVKSLLPIGLELNQINKCDYRIKKIDYKPPFSREVIELSTGKRYNTIAAFRKENKIHTLCSTNSLIEDEILVEDFSRDITLNDSINFLGLGNTNSYNKFIPDLYKYSNVKDRYSLLQGLMDGDGYVTKFGKIIYNTSSSLLKKDVIEVVQSLGGRCTVSEYYPKYTYKEKKLTSKHLHYRISITIRDPENIVSLPRKLERVQNRKYQVKFLDRIIKKVEYSRTTKAQCIMVSAKDSLYVTNDFIVTHNTFLSCAEALHLLKTEPQYRRIMLVKSVTVLKGEEVGFLKGTLEEKLSPFMESFKDNFNKLIGKGLTEKLHEQGVIEIQPLTYLRGRTIDNTIIIIDEAQNISFDNMKTILTRIGENSKIVIIGDQRQVDLRNKKESCLSWLAERFEKNDKFGVTRFTKDDQVRNPIISVIEDIFDELDK